MSAEQQSLPEAGLAPSDCPFSPSRPLLWGLPALVFLFSVSVLWWNAAPSVTFHDSGEFALAAASAGLPHSPGAPTWTMSASLFLRLGGFDDPARGTNLFCGLMGALTLALAGLAAALWSLHLMPAAGRFGFVAAGLSVPLVLLHSAAFLEQSLMTEQYSQLTALQAAMFLFAIPLVFPGGLFLPSAPQGRVSPAMCAGVLGLLWGLAIGNHLSQLALGLFVAVTLSLPAWRERSFALLCRYFLRAALGLAAGLLVFLWLPIRSRANPLLDSGNPETFERFMFAILRQQWPRRSLDEVPPHFVREWLLTYDLIGELGVVGFLLMIGGVIVLLRRKPLLLVLLGCAVVPYAVGMLLGHMKQAGIDVNYIRHYGVRDWHIPIYLGAAMAAGAALPALLDRVARARPLRVTQARLVVGAALALLFAFSMRSVARESLRGWEAPRQYINDLLAPLPEDAIILTKGDNYTYMLSYNEYAGRRSRRDVLVDAYGKPVPEANEPGGAEPWNEEALIRYVTEHLADPNWQPLRVPPLTRERVASGRVFVTLPGKSPEARIISCLLPVGFMFELKTRPTTDSEVLESEREWRRRYGEIWNRSPGPRTHRLEREARANLHMHRGIFFYGRRMWRLAASEFRKLVEWQPTSGYGWVSLGNCLLLIGAPPEEAEAACREALRLEPWSVPARQQLGKVLVDTGRYDEAEKLLEEALSLSPSNPEEILRNLDYIRSLKKQQTAIPEASVPVPGA